MKVVLGNLCASDDLFVLLLELLIRPSECPITSILIPFLQGAGDAFVGSLAYYTACYESMPLDERIRRACKIASVSVQSPGTQASYPKKDKLPQDLFQ